MYYKLVSDPVFIEEMKLDKERKLKHYENYFEFNEEVDMLVPSWKVVSTGQSATVVSTMIILKDNVFKIGTMVNYHKDKYKYDVELDANNINLNILAKKRYTITKVTYINEKGKNRKFYIYTQPFLTEKFKTKLTEHGINFEFRSKIKVKSL